MQQTILTNVTFWATLGGVIIAQMLKPFIHLIAGGKFDPKLFIANGGMPSSHTAAVCALTTSIGMKNGFGSDLFVISLAVTLIVMNDAMNVRLETGKQAQLLNEWSELLSNMFSDDAFTTQNFKTMIGHTSFQVFWGMIVGVAVGLGTTFIFIHYGL